MAANMRQQERPLTARLAREFPRELPCFLGCRRKSPSVRVCLDFPADSDILKYISNQGCPMRPQKLRLIAAKPACRRFSPDTGNDAPAMTLGLDMLEALRLADAEGLSQEEAARQMEISPPTFCRLLAEARRRVAQALTRGLPLIMEGGPEIGRAHV